MNSKYKTYTDEELLQVLQEFHSVHNRAPLSSDFQDVKPNTSTFYNRFGNWNNALYYYDKSREG